MAYKYLSKEIIAGFDRYKYSSVDTCPVGTYITHPFWNWVVEFYPRWIAPNVLTFVGFLMLVGQYALFTLYDPSFYASADNYPDHPPVPNWVWLAASLSMFLAHTLDGTDGKQARRTKSSSPLGELFDHGLDSWMTLLMSVGVYSIFGRGDHSIDVDHTFYIVMGVMLTFILSHWEKYNTGVLFLPWGYDISQIAMTVVYLVTFILGYSAWKFTLPLFGWTAGQLFEILMYIGFLGISFPMTFWNVYVAYRDGTGKNRSFYEALRPLFGCFILFSSFIIWTQYSSYSILKRQPRLVFTALGSVFSNITCRLIVSQMSDTRCQAYNWLLTPLVAIVLAVFNMQLGVIEVYLLWAYTIFVTAAHIHYGICVVKQMADHFNIYAFSLEKRKKQT